MRVKDADIDSAYTRAKKVEIGLVCIRIKKDTFRSGLS